MHRGRDRLRFQRETSPRAASRETASTFEDTLTGPAFLGAARGCEGVRVRIPRQHENFLCNGCRYKQLESTARPWEWAGAREQRLCFRRVAGGRQPD